MTIEKITEKLEELENSKLNATAQLNAILGAIQVLQGLIEEEMKEKESEEKESEGLAVNK